jgi:protein-tyrosine phosphatase
MQTSIYWLEKFGNGAAVGIMPRPRGNDWLEGEILHLKKLQVQVLVSLLEPAEIKELELSREEAHCHKHGIRFINFPIRDRDIPAAGKNTEAFIGSLLEAIEAGQSVCIHCRMGIGRASIIAGSILLLKGARFDDLIDKISKARGLKVPDTAEQVKWLKARS